MPLTGTPALQVLMKMQTGFVPRLKSPSAWYLLCTQIPLHVLTRVCVCLCRSKAFVSFCHTCLEVDPKKRPTAAELLKVRVCLHGLVCAHACMHMT